MAKRRGATIACSCHPEEDVQCGRCGSSMGWTECEGCDGGQYLIEDPEDSGYDEWATCPACDGRGGWYVCLSDSMTKATEDPPSWCEAHPRPGRENTPCSTEEVFSIHELGCPVGPTTSRPVPGLGHDDSTAPDPLDTSESRTDALRTTAPLGPEDHGVAS